MSDDKALIVAEAINPVTVFVPNGGEALIETVRTEVAKLDADVKTEDGRKAIKSLAHKIARSKTAVDDAGKEFVAKLKEQSKIIDNERSRIWDALEAMQKEVRRPLTEWENADNERIAAHKARLTEIQEISETITNTWQTIGMETMEAALKTIEEYSSMSWDEFLDLAQEMFSTAKTRILSGIEKRKQYESDQAELKRLRDEAAAREKQAYEDKLKADAAEIAKKEAEAAAARAAKEAHDKAEIERIKLQREKEEAEARERKAIADKETAVQAERDRAETAKLAEEAAAAKRASDVMHKTKINNDVLQNMVKHGGITDEQAKAIITAIVMQEIPHTKIIY